MARPTRWLHKCWLAQVVLDMIYADSRPRWIVSQVKPHSSSSMSRFFVAVGEAQTDRTAGLLSLSSLSVNLPTAAVQFSVIRRKLMWTPCWSGGCSRRGLLCCSEVAPCFCCCSTAFGCLFVHPPSLVAGEFVWFSQLVAKPGMLGEAKQRPSPPVPVQFPSRLYRLWGAQDRSGYSFILWGASNEAIQHFQGGGICLMRACRPLQALNT